MNEITAQDIDAVLVFLPTFEVTDYQGGEWRAGAGDFPFFQFDEKLGKFVETLYEHGWVVPFDWPAWQETAARYAASPEAVAGADLDVIRKLLTTHVRQDRFCEGHLAEMIRTGHIAALLRRLRELRNRGYGS